MDLSSASRLGAKMSAEPVPPLRGWEVQEWDDPSVRRWVVLDDECELACDCGEPGPCPHTLAVEGWMEHRHEDEAIVAGLLA